MIVMMSGHAVTWLCPGAPGTGGEGEASARKDRRQQARTTGPEVSTGKHGLAGSK